MAMGQEAAAGLWQAATSGGFTLTPEAAHELAGHYQWFAEEMAKRQEEVKMLARLTGFGGLQSARDLQSGFEEKAVQAFEAYRTAEESSYRMQQAILRAAGLMEDVDSANSSAIAAAGKEIGL